jgi:uncharacterized membrane protein
MRKVYFSARARLGLALAVVSGTSIALYFTGVWGRHEQDFAYMIWNLVLAWAALGITLFLERTLHRTFWSSWYALVVTTVWMLFLPNTFYMVTDFIHVRELPEESLLTGIFMFSSFIFTGLILGMISIYIIHRELLKRVAARTAWMLVTTVILLCSFAMYIGRELRWNSWDIIANPSSLLFDVTDRFLNAKEHPHMWPITFSFFTLIISMYVVVWHMARVARGQRETSSHKG